MYRNVSMYNYQARSNVDRASGTSAMRWSAKVGVCVCCNDTLFGYLYKPVPHTLGGRQLTRTLPGRAARDVVRVRVAVRMVGVRRICPGVCIEKVL